MADRDGDDSPLFDRGRYDLNSKIMVTAIISLSVVVVLVTLLHIYARCFLRRQARRRSALRQLGIITSAHVHSGDQPPKRGLDPSVIASMPIFVFKSSDHGSSSSNEMGSVECSVCLSNLADGEMVRTLPNCKHTFHAECIDKWFNSRSTCPVCRTEAEPKVLVPEPREGVVVNMNPPTAPPMECANSGHITSMEGSSEGGIQSSAKINGSSSRLTSFRRMLTRDRSSRRIQSCGQDVALEDLERQ